MTPPNRPPALSSLFMPKIPSVPRSTRPLFTAESFAAVHKPLFDPKANFLNQFKEMANKSIRREQEETLDKAMEEDYESDFDKDLDALRAK